MISEKYSDLRNNKCIKITGTPETTDGKDSLHPMCRPYVGRAIDLCVAWIDVVHKFKKLHTH